MAWETRESGRSYFYLSERQPDGGVRKRYLGNGLLAEVESIRLERKVSLRQQRLLERKTILELESMTTDYAQSARITVDAHFYAAGFHNPKSRGWRRRREMIKPVEADDLESQSRELQETGTEEITMGELVSRCRRGDKQAAGTLRRVLDEHPDLYDGLGHVSQKVQVKWIRAITGSDLFEREMLLRATVKLRQALIDEGTGTQLERLVIEQVVSSHLQQGFHESREAESASKVGETSKYRLDAMERAAGRHVKALGALATLRSMMPSLAEEDHHRSTTSIGESPEVELEKLDHSGVNRLLDCFKDQAHASVTD
jgi:hypothetical protein